MGVVITVSVGNNIGRVIDGGLSLNSGSIVILLLRVLEGGHSSGVGFNVRNAQIILNDSSLGSASSNEAGQKGSKTDENDKEGDHEFTNVDSDGIVIFISIFFNLF